jgi:hypothetical protein
VRRRARSEVCIISMLVVFWECIYGFGIGQDSLQVLGVRLPQEPAADEFLFSSLGLYTCMFGAVAINLWLDSLFRCGSVWGCNV